MICNYEENRPVTVAAWLEKGEPLSRYRLVDDPTWKQFEGEISVPPQSAVVVI